MTQPPTDETTELHLGPDIAKMVAETYVPNDRPMAIGYVDADGRPNLSFRGSVIVYSPTQLGLWARNPEGGLPKAIPGNPSVTLLYREPNGPNGFSRAALTFKGRASVVTDEAVRRGIYEQMPQRERDADKDYRGVAILVDLESVTGGIAGTRVRMVRS